jgi:hypothetical protein
VRRSSLVVATLAALAGAGVGVVSVLTTRWWSTRHGSGDFGWTAYSPLGGQPPRYADYLPATQPVDWWALLVPAALAGAALALLLVAAVSLVNGRRATSARSGS